MTASSAKGVDECPESSVLERSPTVKSLHGSSLAVAPPQESRGPLYVATSGHLAGESTVNRLGWKRDGSFRGETRAVDEPQGTVSAVEPDRPTASGVEAAVSRGTRLRAVASDGHTSRMAQLERELEDTEQAQSEEDSVQIPKPRHVKYATVMAENLKRGSLRVTRESHRSGDSTRMTPEEKIELTRAQREVMWNLQGDYVVTVVGPGDDPVPYKRQGNPAMNTPQSVKRRQALRKKPLIQEISNEYWCFPGLNPEGSGEMTKESYINLNRKLHLALIPDTTDEEALKSAEVDWSRDTARWGGSMTEEAFASSMFELADIWTENIDEEEYTAFLWLLLETITNTNVVPPSFKPDREIECIVDKGRSEATSTIRDALAAAGNTNQQSPALDMDALTAELAANRNNGGSLSPQLKDKHVQRLRALRQRLQALKQLRTLPFSGTRGDSEGVESTYGDTATIEGSSHAKSDGDLGGTSHDHEESGLLNGGHSRNSNDKSMANTSVDGERMPHESWGGGSFDPAFAAGGSAGRGEDVATTDSSVGQADEMGVYRNASSGGRDGKGLSGAEGIGLDGSAQNGKTESNQDSAERLHPSGRENTRTETLSSRERDSAAEAGSNSLASDPGRRSPRSRRISFERDSDASSTGAERLGGTLTDGPFSLKKGQDLSLGATSTRAADRADAGADSGKLQHLGGTLDEGNLAVGAASAASKTVSAREGGHPLSVGEARGGSAVGRRVDASGGENSEHGGSGWRKGGDAKVSRDSVGVGTESTQSRGADRSVRGSDRVIRGRIVGSERDDKEDTATRGGEGLTKGSTNVTQGNTEAGAGGSQVALNNENGGWVADDHLSKSLGIGNYLHTERNISGRESRIDGVSDLGAVGPIEPGGYGHNIAEREKGDDYSGARSTSSHGVKEGSIHEGDPGRCIDTIHIAPWNGDQMGPPRDGGCLPDHHESKHDDEPRGGNRLVSRNADEGFSGHSTRTSSKAGNNPDTIGDNGGEAAPRDAKIETRNQLDIENGTHARIAGATSNENSEDNLGTRAHGVQTQSESMGSDKISAGNGENERRVAGEGDLRNLGVGRDDSCASDEETSQGNNRRMSERRLPHDVLAMSPKDREDRELSSVSSVSGGRRTPVQGRREGDGLRGREEEKEYATGQSASERRTRKDDSGGRGVSSSAESAMPRPQRNSRGSASSKGEPGNRSQSLGATGRGRDKASHFLPGGGGGGWGGISATTDKEWEELIEQAKDEINQKAHRVLRPTAKRAAPARKRSSVTTRSTFGLADRGFAKEKNSSRDRLEHAPSHAEKDGQSGIKSNDVAKMNVNVQAATMAIPGRKTPVPGSSLSAREEPLEDFGNVGDVGGFEAAPRRADDHGFRSDTTNGDDGSLVSGRGKGGAGISTTVPGGGGGGGTGDNMAGEQVGETSAYRRSEVGASHARKPSASEESLRLPEGALDRLQEVLERHDMSLVDVFDAGETLLGPPGAFSLADNVVIDGRVISRDTPTAESGSADVDEAAMLSRLGVSTSAAHADREDKQGACGDKDGVALGETRTPAYSTAYPTVARPPSRKGFEGPIVSDDDGRQRGQMTLALETLPHPESVDNALPSRGRGDDSRFVGREQNGKETQSSRLVTSGGELVTPHASASDNESSRVFPGVLIGKAFEGVRTSPNDVEIERTPRRSTARELPGREQSSDRVGTARGNGTQVSRNGAWQAKSASNSTPAGDLAVENGESPRSAGGDVWQGGARPSLGVLFPPWKEGGGLVDTSKRLGVDDNGASVRDSGTKHNISATGTPHASLSVKKSGDNATRTNEYHLPLSSIAPKGGGPQAPMHRHGEDTPGTNGSMPSASHQTERPAGSHHPQDASYDGTAPPGRLGKKGYGLHGEGDELAVEKSQRSKNNAAFGQIGKGAGTTSSPGAVMAGIDMAYGSPAGRGIEELGSPEGTWEAGDGNREAGLATVCQDLDGRNRQYVEGVTQRRNPTIDTDGNGQNLPHKLLELPVSPIEPSTVATASPAAQSAHTAALGSRAARDPSPGHTGPQILGEQGPNYLVSSERAPTEGRGYPAVAAGVTSHEEAKAPSDGGQRWRGGSFTRNRGVLNTIAVTGTKMLVDSETGAGCGDRFQPGTVGGSAAATQGSSANAQEKSGMVLRRSSSSGAVWKYDALEQHQENIAPGTGASSVPSNQGHEIGQNQQDVGGHSAVVGLRVGEARRPSQQRRPSATMGGMGKIFRPLSRTDSREPHLIVHSRGVSDDAPRSEARQSVVETALADERDYVNQRRGVMTATAPRALEGTYLPRMEVIPGRIRSEVVITLPSGWNRSTGSLDLTGGTANVDARDMRSTVGAAVGDEKEGKPCRGREQDTRSAPQRSGHSPGVESLGLEKETAASGHGTANVESTSIGGLRTIKMHSSTRAEEYGKATEGRSSRGEHKGSIAPTQLLGLIGDEAAMEEVAATVAFRITSMDGTRYGEIFAEVKQALMGVGEAKPETRATSGIATSSGRTTPTKGTAKPRTQIKNQSVCRPITGQIRARQTAGEATVTTRGATAGTRRTLQHETRGTESPLSQPGLSSAAPGACVYLRATDERVRPDHPEGRRSEASTICEKHPATKQQHIAARVDVRHRTPLDRLGTLAQGSGVQLLPQSRDETMADRPRLQNERNDASHENRVGYDSAYRGDISWREGSTGGSGQDSLRDTLDSSHGDNRVWDRRVPVAAVYGKGCGRQSSSRGRQEYETMAHRARQCNERNYPSHANRAGYDAGNRQYMKLRQGSTGGPGQDSPRHTTGISPENKHERNRRAPVTSVHSNSRSDDFDRMEAEINEGGGGRKRKGVGVLPRQIDDRMARPITAKNSPHYGQRTTRGGGRITHAEATAEMAIDKEDGSKCASIRSDGDDDFPRKNPGDRYYLPPPQRKGHHDPSTTAVDSESNVGQVFSRQNLGRPRQSRESERERSRSVSACIGKAVDDSPSKWDRDRKTSLPYSRLDHDHLDDDRPLPAPLDRPEWGYGWRGPLTTTSAVPGEEESQPYYVERKQVWQYVPGIGLPPWRTPAPGEPGWEPIRNYCEVKRDEKETLEEQKRRDYLCRRRRQSGRDGRSTDDGGSSYLGGGSSLSSQNTPRQTPRYEEMPTAPEMPPRSLRKDDDENEAEDDDEDNYDEAGNGDGCASVAKTSIARRVNAVAQRPATTVGAKPTTKNFDGHTPHGFAESPTSVPPGDCQVQAMPTAKASKDVPQTGCLGDIDVAEGTTAAGSRSNEALLAAAAAKRARTSTAVGASCSLRPLLGIGGEVSTSADDFDVPLGLPSPVDAVPTTTVGSSAARHHHRRSSLAAAGKTCYPIAEDISRDRGRKRTRPPSQVTAVLDEGHPHRRPTYSLVNGRSAAVAETTALPSDTMLSIRPRTSVGDSRWLQDVRLRQHAEGRSRLAPATRTAAGRWGASHGRLEALVPGEEPAAVPPPLERGRSSSPWVLDVDPVSPELPRGVTREEYT